MRIQTIIHAPFEKLGIIETWAKRHSHSLASAHTYQGDSLPSASEFDFLVIMGGPQSPLEVDLYPYLRAEITLAKQAVLENKAVLGVCLGAQIIAEALGARTERSPHKEVGVYPLELSPAGQKDALFKHFPQSFDVMHWHNDMPGLPTGSEVLASSQGCPRQIVRFNERAYGLQCHLEMTTELIKSMLEHCSGDLKPGQYVQSAEKLLSHDMSEINHKMEMILDYMAASVHLTKVPS